MSDTPIEGACVACGKIAPEGTVVVPRGDEYCRTCGTHEDDPGQLPLQEVAE